MTYNNLTGHVIANIDYRLKQTDDSSQVEDHGIITYDLSIGSGTGIAQANEVWYSDRTFTTTDSVDLAFLSQTRLGQVFNTSFIGIGSSGNIKGFKVDNLSVDNIYVHLPFGACSGNFKLAPSGSFAVSNANGWPINSSSTIILISGDNSNAKNYNLGLIGVALPAIFNLEEFLNYEYTASGDSAISGTLLIDYIASSVHTGTLPFEYLLEQSSINSGILEIEYLKEIFFGATGTGHIDGSGTGTMIPIEYFGSFSGVDGILNIEYSGFASTTGVNGSSTFELLKNPTFTPGCVTCDFMLPKTDSTECNSGVDIVVGYPYWYISGDFNSRIKSSLPKFSLGGSRYEDLDANGHSYCPSDIEPLRILPVHSTIEAYIKQTVTVIPGAEYRFEWIPTDLSVALGQLDDAKVELIAGNGHILAERFVTQQWFNVNKNTLQFLTAVALDNQLTVKFVVPSDVSTLTNSSMQWGGTTPSNSRVSLYRIS